MKFLFPVAALSLLLTGCLSVTDIKAPDYSPDYAIPLAKVSTSVGAIFENFDTLSTLEVDAEGGMTLRYYGEIRQRPATDFFAFLNGIPAPIINDTMPIPLQLNNGIRLDYALLKSGKIQATFFRDAPNSIPWTEPIVVSFTVPQFIQPDGQPFSKTITVPNFPISADSTNIAGYAIVPQNDTLWMLYEAHGLFSNEPFFFDTLQFNLIPGNMVASYAEGYLGQEIYQIPLDTIGFEYLESVSDGEIYFGDPKIRVYSENAFGFPVRAEANVVNVFTRSGESIALESDVLFEGIDFAYPSLSEVGEVKFTDFFFDKDNSNIREIIAGDPIAVEYQFTATTNPDNNSSITGFITDSSYFKVGVEVELPLYASAKGFPAKDSFDINPDFDISGVDSAQLKIIATNSVPLDAQVQILMTDGNGVVLDSVFQQGAVLLLQGAPYDSNGEVTGPATQITFADLPMSVLQNLKACRRLVVCATFATTDNGADLVRTRITQGLSLDMGVILHMSTN